MPTSATGTSAASACAPSGPPESRSAARPPTNAHQTPSRAPAATDQQAATSTTRFGRAPPMEIDGATDPCRSAATSGTTMARATRTTSLLCGGTRIPPACYAPRTRSLGADPGADTGGLGLRRARVGRGRELLAERRERVFVAELRADIDENEAERGGDRHREHDAQQAERRAARQQGEDDDRG